MTCPAQWFFAREAGGVSAAHQAVNLGQIVHALAERVATKELAADVDVLMVEVDAVWGRLAFRTPWSRKREHDRIRKAIARFVEWHESNPRQFVDSETRFRTVVEVHGQEIALNGTADRLELTADGEVVVVDFKTSRSAPSAPAVKGNLQLALYQYAVDAGALDERPRPADPLRRRRAGAARHPGRHHRGQGPGPGRACRRRARARAAAGRPGAGGHAHPRRDVPGGSRASTAATARSSRSARPRAQAR